MLLPEPTKWNFMRGFFNKIQSLSTGDNEHELKRLLFDSPVPTCSTFCMHAANRANFMRSERESLLNTQTRVVSTGSF